MYFLDFQASPDLGPWQGLDITIAPADLAQPRPAFRVEAVRGHIRLVCASKPVLWARIHRHYHGLWRLLANPASSWNIVRPIRASDINRIKAPSHTQPWWRAWARWFARALVASPHTPLYPGRWALTPARAADVRSAPVPAGSPADWTQLNVIDSVKTCLQDPALQWESWWISGSGAILRTRAPSPPDSGRVHALVKHARQKTLPPILTQYISGLDMFIVLDGHDRLQAALSEPGALALLVLWQVRAYPRPSDPTRQEAIVREVLRKRQFPPRERHLDTAAENRLLIEAFDTRDWLFPTTRAFRLPGGIPSWEEEVMACGEVSRQHPLVTGEAPERS